MKKSRAEICEDSFTLAQQLAEANGFRLTNPSDGCYQLRHVELGWIYNLYPRRLGFSPRIYSDRHHRGPYLTGLPSPWTLLDVVESAVAAAGKAVAS